MRAEEEGVACCVLRVAWVRTWLAPCQIKRVGAGCGLPPHPGPLPRWGRGRTILLRWAIQTRRFQIKRVLRIARGVVGGRVQGVEAMVFVLEFRSVSDGETNLAEAPHDVFGDLRERMQLADRTAASGQGEIGGFLRQRGLKFQFFTARRDSGFEFNLGLVDELAGGGT